MARKDFELQKDVDINDIYLDPENARIRSGSSQEECITKVLRKSDQLLVLMRSIVNDGLSTIPILLTPHDSQPGKWIVKDGNRRITALKLLLHPELCQDVVLREKIIHIANSSADVPTAVDCYSSTIHKYKGPRKWAFVFEPTLCSCWLIAVCSQPKTSIQLHRGLVQKRGAWHPLRTFPRQNCPLL